MTTLLKTARIEVFTNGSGEVFIKHDAGPTLRVGPSPTGKGLICTAHSYSLIPDSLNGLSAFRVEKVGNW